jgi:hypothetical protein
LRLPLFRVARRSHAFDVVSKDFNSIGVSDFLHLDTGGVQWC